jgi:hypothetical protein
MDCSQETSKKKPKTAPKEYNPRNTYKNQWELKFNSSNIIKDFDVETQLTQKET